MKDRRIRKVKLDGSRVEIKAIETWGIGNEREWTLRCWEDPDPKLPAAFAALPPQVRDLLELPKTWADGKLKVLSVSFSWSESTEVKGASICCRADLDCATSPLIFNTPHLPFAQYSAGGEQPVMPDELIELLEEVELQARRYLDGARAQEDLFAVHERTKAEPALRPDPEPAKRDLVEAVVSAVETIIAPALEPEPMPKPGPTKKQRVKAAAKATADKYFKAGERPRA